jgi:hypothetical protein
LEIWRIENKKPTPWPADKFGQFYAGDSYLILNTTVSKSGKFEWDLFFWLGKDSSVDEMGIAAYKTVPSETVPMHEMCIPRAVPPYQWSAASAIAWGI